MSVSLPPFVVIPATKFRVIIGVSVSPVGRASATDSSGAADNLFHYSLYALLFFGSCRLYRYPWVKAKVHHDVFLLSSSYNMCGFVSRWESMSPPKYSNYMTQKTLQSDTYAGNKTALR